MSTASDNSRAAPAKRDKHEHTPTVGSRRDKFLGHEIHPVVQRAHHAGGGEAIEQVDLLRTAVLVEEHNRSPAFGRVPPVDVVSQVVELLVEPPVSGDMNPARRPNLHEAERGLQLRMPVQQSIDGTEAFGNALRIVHTIDADEQLLIAQVEPLPQPPLRAVQIHRQRGGHRRPDRC